MKKTGPVHLPLIMKLTAALLTFILCTLPLFSAGTGTDTDTEKSYTYDQGKLDGKKDAKGNGIFFLTGLTGPLAFILPWVIGPKVPTDHLVGKPEEYVDGYMDGYTAQAKLKNFGWAMAGFGTVAVVVGVTIGIVLVATVEAAGTSCGNSLGSSCSPNINCGSNPLFEALFSSAPR